MNMTENEFYKTPVEVCVVNDHDSLTLYTVTYYTLYNILSTVCSHDKQAFVPPQNGWKLPVSNRVFDINTVLSFFFCYDLTGKLS